MYKFNHETDNVIISHESGYAIVQYLVDGSYIYAIEKDDVVQVESTDRQSIEDNFNSIIENITELDDGSWCNTDESIYVDGSYYHINDSRLSVDSDGNTVLL